MAGDGNGWRRQWSAVGMVGDGNGGDGSGGDDSGCDGSGWGVVSQK